MFPFHDIKMTESNSTQQNFLTAVKPLKTDTLRDRLKGPPYKCVRLIEVLEIKCIHI